MSEATAATAPQPADLRTSAEVVVIGAGLSGLAAALTLQQAGKDVVLLEANDRPGGRVRTDLVAGFRLDRGYQLLNPAYPAARRLLDLSALQLQPSFRGLRLWSPQRSAILADPRSASPASLLEALSTGLSGRLGSPFSVLNLLRYFWSCARTPVSTLRRRIDTTIAEALRAAGVNQATQRQLLVPFLAGVLGEDQLATSRRYADLVFRSFALGTPALPAAGMQAMPDQLAAQIEQLYCHTPVTHISHNTVHSTLGTISASAIVLATDAPARAQLLGQPNHVQYWPLTTWYFAVDKQRGPLLNSTGVLTTPSTGPIVNTAVVSDTAHSYAPDSQHLIAASAIGTSHPGSAVIRKAVAQIYGVGVQELTEIGHYQIEKALPRSTPPHKFDPNIRVNDYIVLAGDDLATPSIQGALASGTSAARTVLHGS